MSASICGTLLLLLFFSICAARDLPSYFPRCNIDDEKLNDCILNASKILKPNIVDGIKEIRLPSFNPLRISSYTVEQNKENFRYNATFSNITARGLNDYDFDEIIYNPQTRTLSGAVKFHNVSYSCNYEMHGWIFYFPVLGSGIMDGKFHIINGTFEIKGKTSTHKRREYYLPISAQVRMTITGHTVYFTGLFEDNAELAHLTNELVNINGQRIADAATPALEEITERFLMKFVKSLTKLVPYNKLFPHS